MLEARHHRRRRRRRQWRVEDSSVGWRFPLVVRVGHGRCATARCAGLEACGESSVDPLLPGRRHRAGGRGGAHVK
eukprot:scaffold3945_cov105-Isochrysis_galbana.AAC.14